MPTHVSMRRGDIEFIYDALGNKWYQFSKDGAAEEAKGTAYIFGVQKIKTLIKLMPMI